VVVEQQGAVAAAVELGHHHRRRVRVPVHLDAGRARPLEQGANQRTGLLEAAALGGDAGLPDQLIEDGQMLGQMGRDVRSQPFHGADRNSSSPKCRTLPGLRGLYGAFGSLAGCPWWSSAVALTHKAGGRVSANWTPGRACREGGAAPGA